MNRNSVIHITGSTDRVFSRRPVFAVNVSGLLWMGGYTRDKMFDLAVVDKTLVRRVIADFIEAKGAPVLVILHVHSPMGEGDPFVCYELVRESKPVYRVPVFTMKLPFNKRKVRHVIVLGDLFVGARMHSFTPPLWQYLRATGMAYSGKFIGVLRRVSMD
jgi:colanic acid/amylovoran biosynthesis protein